MMRGLFSSFLRDERGAAASEMALMLPLLLVLMFAPMEMGNFFWSQHKVTKGVRDAARFAARQPFSTMVCDEEIADDRIKNLARTGQLNGTSSTISGWVNDDITVTVICDDTFSSGIYNGRGSAPIIRVETTLNYPSLFQTLGFDTTEIEMTAFSEAAGTGI
jgi:Flp pilus assembly protein TadG